MKVVALQPVMVSGIQIEFVASQKRSGSSGTFFSTPPSLFVEPSSASNSSSSRLNPSSGTNSSSSSSLMREFRLVTTREAFLFTSLARSQASSSLNGLISLIRRAFEQCSGDICGRLSRQLASSSGGGTYIHYIKGLVVVWRLTLTFFVGRTADLWSAGQSFGAINEHERRDLLQHLFRYSMFQAATSRLSHSVNADSFEKLQPRIRPSAVTRECK